MNNSNANDPKKSAEQLKAEMKKRFNRLQWGVIGTYVCLSLFLMSQPELTKDQRDLVIIAVNLVIIAVVTPIGLKIAKIRKEADKLEAEQEQNDAFT